MKNVQVKPGKPSKFYVNNKKISLNTAFGMYQNGAKFNLKFGTHLSIDDIIRERIKLSTIKDIINNPKFNLPSRNDPKNFSKSESTNENPIDTLLEDLSLGGIDAIVAKRRRDAFYMNHLMFLDNISQTVLPTAKPSEINVIRDLINSLKINGINEYNIGDLDAVDKKLGDLMNKKLYKSARKKVRPNIPEDMKDYTKSCRLWWKSYGKCPVNKCPDNTYNPVVEHKHIVDKKGPIRGIMCGKCNTKEGQTRKMVKENCANTQDVMPFLLSNHIYTPFVSQCGAYEQEVSDRNRRADPTTNIMELDNIHVPFS